MKEFKAKTGYVKHYTTLNNAITYYVKNITPVNLYLIEELTFRHIPIWLLQIANIYKANKQCILIIETLKGLQIAILDEC